MAILNRLASAQGRRDEELNKALGQELVEMKNLEGIREIAENLWNKDKKIQSDCDAVMEEIGRIEPELIQEFVFDFIKLLSSKRNRRVWQSMECLALIAHLKAQEIFEQRETIQYHIENGSVITVDGGIKTLGKVAAANSDFNRELFPYLLEQLRTCRPKSVGQFAESIFEAVYPENQAEYVAVLNGRLDILSASQQKRVNKLLRRLE